MTNHKNIIAIDIDSTLHEYMHTVALVALNEFGVRMEGSPEEWSAVFPKEFHPSRYKDIFMRCHDREFIFLTKPYPGAVDSVNELHDMGYEVWYVTDRKLEAYDDTIEWLTLHGFPTPENLHCSRDKREFLEGLGDRLLTMIDDRPRTLVYTRYDLGLENVYSLRHTYNMNFTDIPGINICETWGDILDTFKEHHNGEESSEENRVHGASGLR